MTFIAAVAYYLTGWTRARIAKAIGRASQAIRRVPCLLKKG